MDNFSSTNGSEGTMSSSKETQSSLVWGQDICQDDEIGSHPAKDGSQVNTKASPENTSFVSSHSSGSNHSLCWKLWPLVLTAVVCLVLFALFHDQSGLWKWLENLPWYWSLLVFILLFTTVSFPFGFGYVILNMMCGYLYGFVRGELTVLMAVSVGFSIAFILCRNLFKDYARGVVTSSSSTLCAILQVIDGPNGFKVIFLTRLTPIPFGLQTVLFAITQVSYSQCLLSSTLGLLPLQMLNTYMGSTLRNMQDVLSDRLDNYVVLSGQIISSILLMAYLLRKARRELAKHTRQADIEAGNASINM